MGFIMKGFLGFFIGSLAAIVLYHISPTLCLVVLLPIAIYYAFSSNKEKAPKKSEKKIANERSIIESMKSAISTHPSYVDLSVEEKRDCLLNLQAEAEGILIASKRQKDNFDKMPDGIAKRIESQVIEKFATTVKEAELRSIAIGEMLDELNIGKEISQSVNQKDSGIEKVSIGEVTTVAENKSSWIDDDDD